MNQINIKEISDSCLEKINATLSTPLSKEELSSFTFERMPEDMQSLIIKDFEQRKYMEEKKCNICNQVLLVEKDSEGKQYFRCKNVGDFAHKYNVNVEEIEKNAHLKKEGVLIFEKKTDTYEVVKVYKKNMETGVQTYFDTDPVYQMRSLWVQPLLIEEKEYNKKDGAIFTTEIRQESYEWMLSLGVMRFYKVVKVEDIGLTKIYRGDAHAFERTFRLTIQRLNDEMDSFLLKELKKLREEGNGKFYEATQIEEKLNIDSTYPEFTHKWIVMRLAKLHKDSLLSQYFRGAHDAEWIPDYISKIAKYRFRKQDATFVDEELLKELRKSEREGNKKEVFQKIREKYGDVRSVNLGDGEIVK